MDKKSKDRKDRPKLRKEDIGIPVNFVHVQHVGFSDKQGINSTRRSQSACTSPSPTFDDMNPFFNPNQNRRSDVSIMSGKYLGGGKENRYSNNAPTSLPPYSSMSNLSINNKRKDSLTEMPTQMLLPNKTKPAQQKSSFTGSLLNLNFFPFNTRTTNESKPNNSRSKRLSLGVVSGSMGFANGNQSLGSPQKSPTISNDVPQLRQVIRRRSSSFNGEYDYYNSYIQENPRVSDSIVDSYKHGSSINQIKKPKMQKQLSFPSPPLSPTFDELPPPPQETEEQEKLSPPQDTFDGILPPTPTYDELPPPPEFPQRKTLTRKLSRGNGDIQIIQLPPPPSPPRQMRKKLSTIPNTPPPSPSPSPTLADEDLPPPLPLSPPPKKLNSSSGGSSITSNCSGYNQNAVIASKLKAKLVRVNAPTLPPLSVPLLRPSKESPGTPSTWPLEPEISPELLRHVSQNDQTDNIHTEHNKVSEDGIVILEENGLEKRQSLTTLECMEACSKTTNNKTIDTSHIDPLSRLFQCRMNYSQWPVMMTKLLNSRSKGESRKQTGKVDSLFNDLIKKTLELWLETEGGSATLDDIVSAFEDAQNELEQEQETDVTKL